MSTELYNYHYDFIFLISYFISLFYFIHLITFINDWLVYFLFVIHILAG